jgi:predicted ATP-dependent endonuclease of OLD family
MSKNQTKLTGLYVKNFQSIARPTFISLEKLTFLYRPNSAGKSSIIDALNLIEQVTVKNDTGYNLNYLFRKHAHDGSQNVDIGLEFILNPLSYYSEPEIEKWSNIKDSIGDYLHEEFFKKLKGNKIQIEFSEDCEAIKVAVNSKPLFEISSNATYYSGLHTEIDFDSPDMKDDFSYIFGKLIIYKNNQWLNLLEISFEDLYAKESNKRKKGTAYINYSNDHHYKLLVNEDDEKLIINGIQFFPNKYDNFQLIDLTGSISELLFYEHDDDPENEKIYGKKANDFLNENFKKSSENYEKLLSNRRRLYWKLHDVAHDFNLIVEGFFHQIKKSIERSHVKGDRGLLNSEKPFFVPSYQKITKAINLATDQEHLKAYAEYLSCPKEKAYLSSQIKYDFINQSFSKNLISLRGYCIDPEVHLVNSPNNGKLEVVYLNVKNSKGEVLGFQDVGSGISYLIPILSSLWASKFSIIEQPELHLHPKSQCELGDVFISAFNLGSISLIESHSEHLLLRILRRIRETYHNYLIPKDLKISQEDISIYYFDPQPNGETLVKLIRVDKYGELLDLWPGGFFSERDSELFS